MKGLRDKNELLIPFLQVLTDVVGIEASFLASYWLRFYSPLTAVFPVAKGFPSLHVYLVSSLVVMLVWLLIFRTMRSYGARRNAGAVDETYSVVKGVTLGMLVVMASAFFYRGFSYSRLVFVLIWATSIVILTVSRILLIHHEKRLHRRRRGLLRAAIIGSSKWGDTLFTKVNRRPGLGLHIVGHMGQNASLAEKIPCLGDFRDIAGVVEREGVSILFLALDETEMQQLFLLINECSGLNVKFYLIPNLLEMMTSQLCVEELEGIPVLKIKDVAMSDWNRVFKRVFDVLVSSVALLLMCPLSFVIAVAIVLVSKGGVFYKQTRLGIDGREFELYKFRTMPEGAESDTGPVWTVKGDPRVTGVGRLLRRTSLDELPQVWNILKGDMSLVGPRPERPHFVRQFSTRIPKYLERQRVKSGMTGWAQVNGLRGNVAVEERTQYDLYYVENWSLLLDIKILLMTCMAVLRGENSY
ncbi:MAG: undecaprenyl-phosphate glucose phosphotransferase [Candidatus Eisenbacteria bacterium]|nr:undecaprenyl-phosphate glucose phosphotransferase [Candidatus Eisenbacteria bacterium]